MQGLIDMIICFWPECGNDLFFAQRTTTVEQEEKKFHRSWPTPVRDRFLINENGWFAQGEDFEPGLTTDRQVSSEHVRLRGQFFLFLLPCSHFWLENHA